MGAFICQIKKEDWRKSKGLFVYGNREGTLDDNGKPKYFRDHKAPKKGLGLIQSVIEDLSAMKEGDILFFHLMAKAGKGTESSTEPAGEKEEKGRESMICGVYAVKGEPFFQEDSTLYDSEQPLKFPYRFAFGPHPDHEWLCNHDIRIPVGEFYRLIEDRQTLSIMTLEGEVRGARHAVKKILRQDAQKIIELLYRAASLTRRSKQDAMLPKLQKSESVRREGIQPPALRNGIAGIGEVEYSIKALMAYRLAREDQVLRSLIPACGEPDYDFIIEAFLGQTMRTAVDFLCVDGSQSRVTIVEVKNDKAEIDALAQAIDYQDLFRFRNAGKLRPECDYSICLVAMDFEEGVSEYCSMRNEVIQKERTSLIKYIPLADGRDAEFKLEDTRKIPWEAARPGSPATALNDRIMKKIASKPTEFYERLTGKKISETVVITTRGTYDDSIILEKNLQMGTKTSLLSRVFVCHVSGECQRGQFTGFMNRIYEKVKESGWNFMNIEPVLIADSFEENLEKFRQVYNQNETSARRQPISFTLLSTLV